MTDAERARAADWTRSPFDAACRELQRLAARSLQGAVRLTVDAAGEVTVEVDDEAIRADLTRGDGPNLALHRALAGWAGR